MEESLLTEDEQKVVNHLAEAWNAYVKIGKLHPSDTDDFAKAIHDAQKIIMWRPMLREYGWQEGGVNNKRLKELMNESSHS